MTSRITQDPGRGELGFPKLMIAEDGRVVLFLKYGEGFCVADRNGNLTGFMENDDAWNMGVFTDFHGTVELSND